MEVVLNQPSQLSQINRLGTQTCCRITEPSEIAAARRTGNSLARQLGFDETRTGQLALLITEAGTNIIKHAERGEILLRALHRGDLPGVEVLAIDSGPGIVNLNRQMEDGQSSAGTYGVGLGAMRRLAHEFDIYAAPGKGTAVSMVIWRSAEAPPAPLWQIGAVCLPLPSEQACGDAWQATAGPGGLSLLVADGLGHGPDAALASQAAVTEVDGDSGTAPAQMLQRVHRALGGTRGAAVALAHIDADLSQLAFAGVGNIAACVIEPASRRHLLSHNGIVGSNLRKVQEFVFPWRRDALLILHSDGITTRWDLTAYPGLEHCHPGLIAAVLYRDFGRQRDDVSVLAVRLHDTTP